MGYLHGAYGEIGEDKVKSAVQASTVVLYVGTAPINLIKGYNELGLINTPIKLENMQQVKKNIGYAADWEKYTLCEAFNYHFNNSIENVGPIYVINVLDPDKIKKTTQTKKTITFANGTAEIATDTIILDTFAIEDKVQGTDYTLEYNYTKQKVVIDSSNAQTPLLGEVEVAYFEVDPTKVTKEDVIGDVSESGKYTGIQAARKLYTLHNAIMNVIGAPGWSQYPEVYRAMNSVSMKLNGHWDAFVAADIPLVCDGEKIDTIAKAKKWAKTNGYSSGRSKICWPKDKYLTEKYHLSTVVIATMLRVDNEHNGVPLESPSNKEIMCSEQYFGEDSENEGYDQETANELNAAGITTAVYWGGHWVLWGPHTAGFQYGADNKERNIFDVNMRMLMHITNGFQERHGTEIDGPMDLSLQQSILREEQETLDSLKAQGALIGNPVIEFVETENSEADMVNGDFVWDIAATPTPPFKSGTAKVCYTDDGFQAYFGGDE